MDRDAQPSLFVSARAATPRVGWSRVARALAVTIVLVLAVAVVTGAVLFTYADWRIDRRDIGGGLGDGAAGDHTPEPIEGVRNVLVVGTDSRSNLSEEQLQQLGTEEISGERADTIMLVHLSPSRADAIVVSFPRDLRVDIPGEGPEKINAARALGGPALLVETVEAFTGIPVHHYVEVDLAGFLRMIEVIGGVEVCLEEPLEDEAAGADLPAGRQVLGPAEAAAYVRARKADPRGDLGRIARQQTFVRQAMKRVISFGTLTNPLRMKQLIDRAAGAVTADQGFSTRDMFRLAWSMRSLDPDQVTMVTVPAEAGPSYVEADPEPAEALFQAIRSDADLPAGDDGALHATLAPSDVAVEILNGAGDDGLATAARQEFEARGFQVVATGNAESFGRQRTVVRFPEELRTAAEFVAAHLPDPQLEVADVARVVVELGTDFAAAPTLASSVEPPVVTPSPTPSAGTPTGAGSRCA